MIATEHQMSLELRMGWQVHDIEDLAAEGRRVKGCPYFAARHFAEDAELVFCPYRSVLTAVSLLRGARHWYAEVYRV